MLCAVTGNAEELGTRSERPHALSPLLRIDVQGWLLNSSPFLTVYSALEPGQCVLCSWSMNVILMVRHCEGDNTYSRDLSHTPGSETAIPRLLRHDGCLLHQAAVY